MFAVRTDPNAPKYHGISLMLIDMHSPGVMLQPLYTLGGWRVNATFLDHVRVPKERLMGQLNEGWRHVITTLGFGRWPWRPAAGCCAPPTTYRPLWRSARRRGNRWRRR